MKATPWVLAICGGWLLACGGTPSVLADYEDASKAASQRGDRPSGPWKPDVRIRLSPKLLDRLVDTALADVGPIEKKWKASGVEIEPKLTPKRVDIDRGDCENCLVATVVLKGTTGYVAPIVGRGSLPTTIEATADLVVGTQDTPEGWTVTAKLAKVRQVDVTLKGIGVALDDKLTAPIAGWIDAQLEELAPFPLAQLDAGELPVLALDVSSRGDGLTVEALTDAARPGALAGIHGTVDVGWQAEVATQSLVSLGRRAAFEAGPQKLGLVAVPNRLSANGTRFELGVRVWRIEGSTWWRDYDVEGQLALKRNKVGFSTTSVTEKASSPGANRADPAAALAQAVFLDRFVELMQGAVPSTKNGVYKETNVSTQLTDVEGTEAALTVRGTISLQ